MATKSLTFMEAVKTCFKKYATFKGRARRSEFWWFALAINIVYWIIGACFHTAAAEAFKDNVSVDDILNGGYAAMEQQATALDSQYQTYYIILGIIYAVVFFATVIPLLAAMVRRLHDVGKSGHMLWLYLVCFVGGLIPVIMCIPDGQPQANQYGESPKYKQE